jgi:hypothetical protein
MFCRQRRTKLWSGKSTEELADLIELRAKGHLSEDEFTKAKARVLDERATVGPSQPPPLISKMPQASSGSRAFLVWAIIFAVCAPLGTYAWFKLARGAQLTKSQQKAAAALASQAGSNLSEPEKIAIANLRTINTASVVFLSDHGGRYPDNLAELASSDRSYQVFLTARNGYVLSLRGTGADYTVTAEPLDDNNRHFFTTTDGVVRWAIGKAAGPQSPDLSGLY